MRNLPAPTRKILKSYSIVLASASPRRALLIKKIPWLRATVFPSGESELPHTGEDPARYAERNAERKAEWVFERTGGVVLGADTVVALGGEVFGKPKSEADAERMLRALCGHTHTVITGFCIRAEAQKKVSHEVTRVTFKAYDEQIVRAYIQSGAPLDKAGAYGLQDPLLRSLIAAVEGDEDNVIGLPVRAIGEVLKEIYKWQ